MGNNDIKISRSSIGIEANTSLPISQSRGKSATPEQNSSRYIEKAKTVPIPHAQTLKKAIQSRSVSVKNASEKDPLAPIALKRVPSSMRSTCELVKKIASHPINPNEAPKKAHEKFRERSLSSKKSSILPPSFVQTQALKTNAREIQRTTKHLIPRETQTSKKIQASPNAPGRVPHKIFVTKIRH